MQQKTKKWLTVWAGAALIMGAVLVRAQNEAAQNPYRAFVKARFDAVAQQVNLSETQRKSIAAIIRQSVPQGRAIVQDGTLSKTQKQQKIKASREETRSRIAALLTPAQRQNVQTLFANREQRLSKVLDEVADELQLSEKQRAEAKPIVQDAIQQGRSIWQSAAGFPQKRAKLLQLHAATHEKLSSILTLEQMRKLDLMRQAARAEVVSRFASWGLPFGKMLL